MDKLTFDGTTPLLNKDIFIRYYPANSELAGKLSKMKKGKRGNYLGCHNPIIQQWGEIKFQEGKEENKKIKVRGGEKDKEQSWEG